MKEIIGSNLEQAMKDFKIKAKKTFESEKDGLDVSLQVWELDEENFHKLCIIQEKDWNSSEHGWWRYSGCNYNKNKIVLGIVKEKSIELFANEVEGSLGLLEDFNILEDSFKNIKEYLSEYIGISKHENYTYFIHSLAELNEMSKSEFMRKYW